MNKISKTIAAIVIVFASAASFTACDDNFSDMDVQSVESAAPSNGDTGEGGGTNPPCEGC